MAGLPPTVQTLSEGRDVHGLIVEVLDDSVATASSSDGPEGNPAYTTTVRDATGFIRLLYRSTNVFKPSEVRKGRVLSISGRVTTFDGRLQLQLGSTWGRAERLKGEGVAPGPSRTAACDASALPRVFGVVVLRDSAGPLQLLVPPPAAAEFAPFLAGPAVYLESDRDAACRALVGAPIHPAGDARLTRLPPITALIPSSSGGGGPSVLTAFVAVCTADVAAQAHWRWVPAAEAVTYWPPACAPLAAQLTALIAAATAAGLLNAVAAPTAPVVFSPPRAPPGPSVAPLLPVTLLSGFLGSGKTTLLQHLLRNKGGLRCAVLVNDMAEVNVDGALVTAGGLLGAGGAMVEMSNGCICCTLREDLLSQVAELAKSGSYDYLVIEASGISEPLQVAQTFTFELPVQPASHAAAAAMALKDVARLDTCVTVVDAAAWRSNLAAVASLRQRHGPDAVPLEDERSVVDLLIDQVEFADVILLNKVDLVTPTERDEVAAVLRALNPSALVVPTVNASVDPGLILGANRFDYARAAAAPGWLSVLRGESVIPETVEYGIASLVYRRRRPFHPGRLHAFLESHFVVSQADWTEAVAAKDAGEACWPPEGSAERAALLKDFEGGDPDGAVGDRRQELVFIGINIDAPALFAALDACLVSDDEAPHATSLPDPFLPWPPLRMLLEGDDDDDDDDGSDGRGDEGDEGSTPVGVIEVLGGGADLQQLLEYAVAPLAVVHWRAGWASGTGWPAEAETTLQAMAGSRPPSSVLILQVDVEASEANAALSLQSLFSRPQSRRPGAHPIPAGGRKLPLVTFHLPPSMQTWRVLSGRDAAAGLEAAVDAALAELSDRPPPPGPPQISAPPAMVLELTRGTSELKALLLGGGSGDRLTVVAWLAAESRDDGVTNGGTAWPPFLTAAAAAEGGRGAAFAAVSVTASTDNATLAARLEPGPYPAVHVYKGARRLVRLEAAGCTAARIAAAVAEHRPAVGPSDATGATGVVVPGPGCALPFDPPAGKLAKAGATRRFPQGTAVFWPKMPCLRCGCPWWFGEDWDAKCARCGWDCEADGYDDDSQPLPAYKGRFDRFTAALREGKTTIWPAGGAK